MTTLRSALLTGLIALALVAVACGDDDDDDDDGNGGEATATEGSGDGNGDGATVDVVIEGFAFVPNEFSLSAGEDVTIGLQNPAGVPHTFTVYLDDAFSEMQGTTVSLAGGAEETVFGTFDAGTYFFRCEIHPATMTGQFTAE